MNRTFIIAEAGVNHNGSLSTAKQMVDAAAEAGCDCIKFQSFVAKNIVCKAAKKAGYQQVTTGSQETQLQMLEKLELSQQSQIELKEYCATRGILFLSAPFDLESVAFLASLDLPIFKIPSGEITNLPYLRAIAACRKRVILSTGMANLSEIDAALKVLDGCAVSLLHCTTEYPCPYGEVNLRAMQTMSQRFHLPVGYSDHTPGIEVAIAAVALGAVILEKHFTLSKTMAGPDHQASLEPAELKSMVCAIRNIEAAMGAGEKAPSAGEMKNMTAARKSIVAKCAIRKGEAFTERNLTTKRPATGISPMNWDALLNTVASKDYQEDEVI